MRGVHRPGYMAEYRAREAGRAGRWRAVAVPGELRQSDREGERRRRGFVVSPLRGQELVGWAARGPQSHPRGFVA